MYESILVEYLKNPQITKDRLYIEMMEVVLSNNSNKIIVDKDIENLVRLLDKNKFIGYRGDKKKHSAIKLYFISTFSHFLFYFLVLLYGSSKRIISDSFSIFPI